VSTHPLIELAVEREVKKVTGFRLAAAELTGAGLAEMYATERQNAPNRHDEDKPYFVGHTGELRSKPTAERAEHLAMALYNFVQDSGEGLELPDGSGLELLDYGVALGATKEDKAIGGVDLLGLVPENRIAVVSLKFVPPQATRGSTGETPLRALIEGLACCAFIEANHEVIATELEERGETISSEPPVLLIMANLRYWELCRKRDAQAGAAWIREMERLGREIEEALGISVQFLGLEVPGDPGWQTEELRPELEGEPEVLTAWEPGAGSPKPKAKTRSGVVTQEIIEADPSRPTRQYGMNEIYTSGDSINHHTLGRGVVQRALGPSKIEVLFDGVRKVLVQGRMPQPEA
jgi:hypothetical protein